MDVPADTLTSEDGKFHCTAAHAVEVAYMLSSLEACLIRSMNPHEDSVLEILQDYLYGGVDPSEVRASLALLAGTTTSLDKKEN